ncbi:hypothetical protein FE257_008125 [Aspergillus nanangensis]|uniref:Zn(2)-C6 fungal-type domain-containing protein n=1 Tax=Aspergillus nanangensis TaxID=2582783 RepID=A0AAD4GTT1_ASPNN|nr:hypothetical protein FE257_008125 [Aspergillus nanangensis]
MSLPTRSADTRTGEKRRMGRSAPRSRTGCTTCKRRKVRCDEATPVCANCARMGAECLYQRILPRRRWQTEVSGNPTTRPKEDQPSVVSDTPDIGPLMDLDHDFNTALPHESNSLFFDFDAFSRNALDLWCSPSTALPPPPDPELSALEEIHGAENDPSARPAPDTGGLPSTLLQTGENAERQNDNNEVSGPGHHQEQENDRSPNKDVNLLRDIVPNFKRMATNIVLAPCAANEDEPDDSITRRSDALGLYFKERVFVPAVTTVDTPSWRWLCCRILSTAHGSSIISNAVVALAQLHFNKFSSTTEHDKGSHVLRNGQNLAQYLYIFARETLINGLDLLKENPSTSLRRELLIGLFLLTCFEFINKEDIHRAHQIEWADYILQDLDENDDMVRQILNWLLLCDMKLVIFGGSGILNRRATSGPSLRNYSSSPLGYPAEHRTALPQSPSAPDLLSPPPDRLRAKISRKDPSIAIHTSNPLPTVKESILRDAVNFHHLSQQFLRKIAMLDRHRRPRGSIEDELEVTAEATQLINDLHQLWQDRPMILNLNFDYLSHSLQPHLAREISSLLCVFRACFWSNFCYLYRAAWWDHSTQGDGHSAAEATWSALRESVGQPSTVPEGSPGHIDVDAEPPINSAAMWALFTFATECPDPGKTSWCIAKLKQLGRVKHEYGPGGEYASIHASKAAGLLQVVIDRQEERGGRVDVRYISLELFGFMFPII